MKIRGLLEPKIEYRELVKKYSQEQLWYTLLGFIPVEDSYYHSIFREDKNPKCTFSYKGDLLWFKDNAKYRDKLYFNVFEAASIIWKLDFPETLKKFERKLSEKNNIKYPKKEDVYHDYDFKCIIRFKFKKWDKNPYKYLDIDIETIKKEGNIFLVDSYYCNTKKDNILRKNRFYNPKIVDTIAYVFESKNVKLHFLNQKFKIYTNTNHSDIYGWNKLENYSIEKPLVITKGLKEYLILLQEGVQVIGIMNEGINIPKDLLEKVQKFKVVYTLMDFDNAGKKASIKYQRKHNFHPYYMTKEKDDLGNPETLFRMKSDGSFKEMIRIFTKTINK